MGSMVLVQMWCLLDLRTKQLGLPGNFFLSVRDLAGVFSKPSQKPTPSALGHVLLTWALEFNLAQDSWGLWRTDLKVHPTWGIWKLRYSSTRCQEALPEDCSWEYQPPGTSGMPLAQSEKAPWQRSTGTWAEGHRHTQRAHWHTPKYQENIGRASTESAKMSQRKREANLLDANYLFFSLARFFKIWEQASSIFFLFVISLWDYHCFRQMYSCEESFFSMSEPVINVNPFLATAGNTADLPLLKLKLHMLGPWINLFQRTFKITLDRQWNFFTSVALSLFLDNEDRLFHLLFFFCSVSSHPCITQIHCQLY